MFYWNLTKVIEIIVSFRWHSPSNTDHQINLNIQVWLHIPGKEIDRKHAFVLYCTPNQTVWWIFKILWRINAEHFCLSAILVPACVDRTLERFRTIWRVSSVSNSVWLHSHHIVFILERPCWLRTTRLHVLSHHNYTIPYSNPFTGQVCTMKSIRM